MRIGAAFVLVRVALLGGLAGSGCQDGVVFASDGVVCGTAEYEGGPIPCRGATIPDLQAISDATFLIRPAESALPCTGFLVGTRDHCGQYAMTNAHCVGTPSQLVGAKIELGRREASCCTSGSRVYSGTPDEITEISNADCSGDDCPIRFIATGTTGTLDYTILRIDGTLPTGASALAHESRVPVVGDKLLVLGHPKVGDEYWQAVSVVDEGKDGAVTHVGTDTFGYRLDTADGNSGSPVWNRDRRKIVGIHYADASTSGACRNDAVKMSAILADRPTRDPERSTTWNKTTADILADGVSDEIRCTCD